MLNKDMYPLPVAVVLPIYRGVGMTVECIEAAMPGILDIPGSQLIAINDASPDEGMQEALDALRNRWPSEFRLLRNARNLGFVATVNRGLRQCPNHDYVLLNSDVIVPSNWLRRLRGDAYAKTNIATVTPLSNNTTICSFPEFLQDNQVPFGLDVGGVDAVFLEPKLECIEAPTGIGFCMYIRNQALGDIGLLDEKAFGRGYGEENDFCQRAIKKGYVNLISPNLYAYHKGGVSFGPEKAALVENAGRMIDSLHPNYHADVQRFIAADLLRRVRITRYISLLAAVPLPKVLHVTHGLGGGTEQHIEELADVVKDRVASLLLTPTREEGVIELRLGVRKTADSLFFHIPRQFTQLVALLRSLGVSAIHYHHLMRLHPVLRELPTILDVGHLLTVHDFYLLGGNPTLTGEDGVFPGFYDENLTNSLFPLPDGVTPAQWRNRYRSIVESAQLVIFPSQSTRSLFGDRYAVRRALVAHHPECVRNTNAEPRVPTPKSRYVVGVIGAIGREKGADLLEALAELANKNSSQLDFVLVGYAYRPLRSVRATGAYKAHELPALLDKHCVDVCLFPARCPETYSYTLSQALDAGLPIAAPLLGAFPERLSERRGVFLFDYWLSPAELLSQLESFVLGIANSGFEAVKNGGAVSQHDTRSGFYVDEYPILAPVLTPSRTPLALDFDIPRSRQRSLRERLLMLMWRVYAHRFMRWVDYVIPFPIRRAAKRFLSRRPLHELV